MNNFAPQGSFGNTYLATYRNYELDDEQLRLELMRDYVNLSSAINYKTNGIVVQVETQNGEQWFGNSPTPNVLRFAFRKAFILPSIAAGASGIVAHGITQVTSYTRIYGTAITDAPDNRPIPHASVTANANIEIIVDDTNITVNVGAASPNILSGIIELEYLKT